MEAKQIEQLINFYNKAFKEKYVEMIQDYNSTKRGILFLLYEPTEYEPYWKIVTVGASDYKMKLSIFRKIINAAGHIKNVYRNEYMMCIDEKINMKDKETAGYFYKKLFRIFLNEVYNREFIQFNSYTRFRNDYNGDLMLGSIFLDPSSLYGNEFATFKNIKNKDVNIVLTKLMDNDDLCNLIDIGCEEYVKTLLDEDSISKPRLKYFLSSRTKHKAISE